MTIDIDDDSLTDPMALLEMESEISEAIFEESRKSFYTFTRSLMIPGQSGPMPLEFCMADFQREVFMSIGPSLEALRDGKKPDRRRWWIERTKKASKDADLAVIVLWLIIFAERPFYAQIGAGTGEQAGIVKSRIENLIQYNPWMNDHVEMVQLQVRSKKKKVSGGSLSYVDIMTTNVNAAHGGIPDLLIINELSHIDKWEFASNLMENADGVAQGMAIIATNAGFKGTPAEVWRTVALSSDLWEVRILDRPAPWHSREFIKDSERRNTPSRFKRLWQGKWVSGKGDALDEADIEKCFILEGPLEPREDVWYVKGVDLGISHDHAALVVLEVDIRDRKIRTAFWKKWEPRKSTGEVDLEAVQEGIFQAEQKYRGITLYDPTEARLMMQQLQSRVFTKAFSFTPKNLNLMAVGLIQAVESRLLEMYDDQEGSLRRDFGKFDIVEKNYGYRLEAVSDEFGHADVGTALVIALVAAIEMLENPSALFEDDEIANIDSSRLTEKEVQELPDSLRELYMGDGVDFSDFAGMPDSEEEPLNPDEYLREEEIELDDYFDDL